MPAARLVEVQDIVFGEPNIDFVLFASVYFGTICFLFTVGASIYNSAAFENFLEFMDSFRASQNDHFERCHCTGDNVCEFPELQSILPGNYRYAVCHFEKTDSQQFEASFRVDLFSKESTLKWIQDFKKSSGVSYRKKRSYAENTNSHVFKIALASKPNGRRPQDQATKKFSKRLLITLERTDLRINNENHLIHEEGFPLKVVYQCKQKGADGDTRHPANVEVTPPPPAQNVPEVAEAPMVQQAEAAGGDGTPHPLQEMLELVSDLERDLRTTAMEKFGHRFEYDRNPGMMDAAYCLDYAARKHAEYLENLQKAPRVDANLRNFNAVMGADFGPALRGRFREMLPPYRLPGLYVPPGPEEHDEDSDSEED